MTSSLVAVLQPSLDSMGRESSPMEGPG